MTPYAPSFPFNVTMNLLTPTTTVIKGVEVKTYDAPTNRNMFYGSFRTFGGTETQNNGVYATLDTAIIETWYRPDIKANCRICLTENPNKVYEVIGIPENINRRNQFLKFKVQAVSGGA